MMHHDWLHRVELILHNTAVFMHCLQLLCRHFRLTALAAYTRTTLRLMWRVLLACFAMGKVYSGAEGPGSSLRYIGDTR